MVFTLATGSLGDGDIMVGSVWSEHVHNAAGMGSNTNRVRHESKDQSFHGSRFYWFEDFNYINTKENHGFNLGSRLGKWDGKATASNSDRVIGGGHYMKYDDADAAGVFATLVMGPWAEEGKLEAYLNNNDPTSAMDNMPLIEKMGSIVASARVAPSRTGREIGGMSGGQVEFGLVNDGSDVFAATEKIHFIASGADGALGNWRWRVVSGGAITNSGDAGVPIDTSYNDFTVNWRNDRIDFEVNGDNVGSVTTNVPDSGFGVYASIKKNLDRAGDGGGMFVDWCGIEAL